jgi:hypothetical protein
MLDKLQKGEIMQNEDPFFDYGRMYECEGGFMCTKTPNSNWKRLSPGQKLCYTLFKQGKLTPEQFVFLFNMKIAG